MAEPELQPTEVDDDVLPDGTEEEPTGIAILEFLEEGNLVELVPNVMDVGSELRRLYEEAEMSMGKWKKKYERAVKLAALIPEAEEKTWPFEHASNLMLPFVTEAALDFHSRTVQELVYGKDIIKTKTYGKAREEKDARAERVSTYMNWQIVEDIPMWRPEQDKMLLALPVTGTAYKKTYFNSDEKAARSDLYGAAEVKFDHTYRTFYEAPEKFTDEEYTRNEVIEFIRGNMKWDLDEKTLPDYKSHPEPFKFIRAYMWIDMDEDGLSEPYEVMYYPETERVVAVYPAYDEEGIVDNEDGEIVKVEMAKIFTQYIFLPDPEGGPMGMGWGILLGDMFEAINSNANQMFDAGTLANLAGNSGLINMQLGQGARGGRQMSGPIDVRLGEMTPVSVGGTGKLADAISQFPYQGPNPSLFKLLEWMVDQIRNMTNAATNMDTNSQEAAIMYLTRLQQGLKVPNSIVTRVYAAAKEEFEKIALINFKHHDSTKYNRVLDEDAEYVMRNDFNPEDFDIAPAADPTQGTDVERMNRAALVWEEAKTDEKGIFAARAAALHFLESLNVPDPELIVPEPDPRPSKMQQLMMAQTQWEVSVQNRELKLKEIQLDLKRAELAMKGVKDMNEMGLQADKTQAEIADLYGSAMKKLWEIGVLQGDKDPAKIVQDLEQTLIDQNAPNIPIPAAIDLPPMQPPSGQQSPAKGAPTG